MFFFPIHNFFALSCCPVCRLQRWVLCWVVMPLCCPEGLLKADETGCITALMKSVSADCTQGQLALQQHSPPHSTGEESWDCESKEWNTKMGTDLAVLGWFYFLRCYMCACLSNWRWTKKALCCARAPLSAYQSSRQPQTLSVEGLELIGILMWTGGIEEVVVGEWWCKWGWRKRRNWCKIENRKRCYRLRVKRNPLKHEGNHCRKKMVRCGKSWKWGMNHSIQDGSDD